ncbi:MAG: NUDIX hydrolase [SAR202 cluster bacterium]|nr:NUDIX hydrolase [SAR202 cluster bacterium]
MKAEKTISSKSIYKGKIFSARVDKVLLANARETVREVVDHGASVVIVPLDGDGNVVLVRQYRYPAEKGLLEVPAGGIDAPESPMECAIRELQEETGYTATDVRPIGEMWMSPGYCTEYMYAFVARGLLPSKLEADDEEAIVVEKVPLTSIPGMIRSGDIQDAKTVAAIYMALNAA